MSLPAHDLDCPSCGQRITYTPPRTSPVERLAAPFEPRPRKGGAQASAGVLVRVLSAYFVNAGLHDQAKAERVARRLVKRALPAKQRRPRT